MPDRFRALVRLGGLVAVCALATTARAQSYTAQVFTAPAGISYFHGTGLNDSGLVATFGYTPAFMSRSFFYDTSVSAAPIAAQVPASFQTAYALGGVNNQGQATGSANGGGFGRAMYWASSTAVAAPLGTLGGLNSQAFGINDAGVMVGYSDSATADFRPAMFTSSGVVDIGATAVNGLAYDVSNSGLIVGLADLGAGHNNAVWFDHANGRVVNLSGAGGEAAAVSVNDLGFAAGTTTPGASQRATLFDLNAGTFLDLGVLSGFNTSNAYSINNAGQVIGIAGAGATARPFIWDASHGMRDLRALIPAGVNLTTVTAINEAGQILGDACVGTVCSVVLLTPVPEPATWALLGSGLALLMRRRRL